MLRTVLRRLRRDKLYTLLNVATSARLLGPMLAEDFAEAQAFVRFRPLSADCETGRDRLIRHGQDAHYWQHVYLADPNVFEVFTHEVLRGDPAAALLDPA